MNIFEQLYELHVTLSQDEMWLSVLDDAFDELGATDIDSLVEKAIEEDEEGIIVNLINEGEDIIATRNESMDEFYGEDDF